MLELRRYQKECLDQLQMYLSAIGSERDANEAFYHFTKQQYFDVPGLPGLPYVCLRVPTGGGKTFMACHALGIVAKEYLQQDQMVCLWLVPSNTILNQTLKALRDPLHPYRQAIDAHFCGNVTVLNLSEALYLQRETLEGDTCIIVSTLAAFRVEDKEGRKIYESAGALQHHFSGLSESLLATLERNNDGTIPYSLANVLRLWEPVVIMDEAHNARTALSFETLERFKPSCIVEFTATPQREHKPEQNKYASNVLSHVSAAQLKAEQMIKLPIRLRTRPEWKGVLKDAVDLQRHLEAVAKQEQAATGEYIRPIVLIQAQPRSKSKDTIDAQTVEAALLEECGVPAGEIAIETAETRQLAGIDLFDPNCEIRYAITQKALAEGWDCSFAYVFCSVADVGSAREVEQLLGRVLRLPNARTKQEEEMNCAYAMISSQQFIHTLLSNLTEALIDNGFQALEAREVWYPQTPTPLIPGPILASMQASVTVEEAPDLSYISEDLSERVNYDAPTRTFTVAGPLTDEQETALEKCFKNEQGQEAVKKIITTLRGKAVAIPTQVEPVRVPALCIRIDGQLELFEEGHFLDTQWSIADCDATLTPAAFPSDVVEVTGTLDITADGKIKQYTQEVRDQQSMLRVKSGWTQAHLVDWLDRNILHEDIPQPQALSFINRVVEKLVNERGIEEDQLTRDRFRLSAAVSQLISKHRSGMRESGYQRLLFSPESEQLETSPDIVFTIDPDFYAPNSYYEGPYSFEKHAFQDMGDFDSAEECECAQFLDNLPEVERWVRNLSRRDNSFWLQTSTDKFYPDFVVELKDGRTLVVEYKGKDRWTTDDSKEKRALGEVWEIRSSRSCLFVMPEGPDWNAIIKKIRG